MVGRAASMAEAATGGTAMRVFVTGATGYVGSRVAARLAARGDAVVGLVRTAAREQALPASVEAHVADLRDADAVIRVATDCDATIHTGFASHGGDWFEAVAVERDLVAGLAGALRGTGKRLIVSNGTAFYGDARGRFLDETQEAPADHPAHVRLQATRPAYATAELHGMELRLASFVHGHGGSVFLPVLCAHARRTGRSLYVGEGRNRVSAVHVDAAADAFVAALDHGAAGGVYHVASDDAPTMRELAHAIALGARAEAASVTQDEAAEATDPFTAMFLALDNGLSSRRARCELGWSPAGSPALLWDVAHGSYGQG